MKFGSSGLNHCVFIAQDLPRVPPFVLAVVLRCQLLGPVPPFNRLYLHRAGLLRRGSFIQLSVPHPLVNEK
jgi:hypothetical protein